MVKSRIVPQLINKLQPDIMVFGLCPMRDYMLVPEEQYDYNYPGTVRNGRTGGWDASDGYLLFGISFSRSFFFPRNRPFARETPPGIAARKIITSVAPFTGFMKTVRKLGLVKGLFKHIMHKISCIDNSLLLDPEFRRAFDEVLSFFFFFLTPPFRL